MTDQRMRALERQVLRGDAVALDALRMEWQRTLVTTKCPRCEQPLLEADLQVHLQDLCPLQWIEGKAPPSQSHEWLPSSPSPPVVPPQPGAAIVATPASSGMQVVTLPPPSGGVGARPRKNPLWYRACLEPGQQQVDFFTGETREIWDTNCTWGHSIPASCYFYFYCFALLPDSEADPDDVLLVRDRGTLEFLYAQCSLLEYPARTVMDDQPKVEEERAERLQYRKAWRAGVAVRDPRRVTRLWQHQKVDVTISGRPVGIQALESFRWRLSLPPGVHVKRPFWSMMVMYGLLLKGIS